MSKTVVIAIIVATAITACQTPDNTITTRNVPDPTVTATSSAPDPTVTATSSAPDPTATATSNAPDPTATATSSAPNPTATATSNAPDPTATATSSAPDPTATSTSLCEPGQIVIVTHEYPIDVIHDNLTAQADPEITATPLSSYTEIPCE